MSEIIQTGFAVSTTTSGRKAFFQVSSVAFSGATATAVTVDTTKVMGLPAKVIDPAYVLTAKFSAGTIDNTSGVVVGLGGGSTTYSTQGITNFTAATPGVVTVPYSPPSGTLVQLTGALGTLTGVSLNVTYWWTNVSSTTGRLSTTQANYLAGVYVATGGTTITSGMSLVPSTTSTPVTPDVRGTYAISGTPDGSKRLLVSMGLTAIQVGPNSTRAGLLGSDQA
jgi:adhesin HecA-like repeat protein